MAHDLLHDCPMKLRYAGTHDGCSDFPAHCHDAWEVIYQRAGCVQTQQGKDVIAMSPGMVLIHPPDVEHADFFSTHYTLFFLHFDVHIPPRWPRTCHDDPHQSIGRVCDSLCREFQGNAPERERILALLAEELDILLRRAYDEQERIPGQWVVAEAQRLLEERYRQSVTMGALAKEIGVSRSSLYAHFLRLRGQTPLDYLVDIRLHHALGLLHHSDMTLDAIADRCGFHSASHLSRHVKAATGASPGRLRKGETALRAIRRKIA